MTACQTTREYTKIFPDGLLTAGSHVEYFFRMSHIATPTIVRHDAGHEQDLPAADRFRLELRRLALGETSRSCPTGGRTPVTVDSARPACWSWTTTTGVVTSGSGWVLADSIGATVAAKYGAHNGWHCDGCLHRASDGSHNYTNETDCGTNPTIAVWKNGGQPGTTWDLYNVKAAESSTTGTQPDRQPSRQPRRHGSAGRASRACRARRPTCCAPTTSCCSSCRGDLNNGFFGAVDQSWAGRHRAGAGLPDLRRRCRAIRVASGSWVMASSKATRWLSTAHDAFLTSTLAVLAADHFVLRIGRRATRRSGSRI